MSFIIAFALGAWGYLNPGVINLSLAELSMQQKRKQVILLWCFAVLLEFIYCFGILLAIQTIEIPKSAEHTIQWISVAVLILFSCTFFYSAYKNPKSKPSEGSFARGMMAALVHPQQIPYWGIWGAAMLQAGYLQSTTVSIFIFALFAALGAGLIFFLSSLLGNWLLSRLQLSHRALQITMGCITLFMALLLAFQ